MTTPAQPVDHHAAVPFWRDVRILRIIAQIIVVLVVAIIIGYLLRNLLTAMNERGMTFSFSFLGVTAGFDIAESPIEYSATDTYGRAFLVGLLNTIAVSVAGIILATILGLIVGIARLSSNWLVSKITAGYVELMRNTPLLVQLVLIYFAVLLRLPPMADSISWPGSIYLNQRGLFLPAPVLSDTFTAWLILVLVGLAGIVIAGLVAGRREEAGRPIPRLRSAALVLFAILAIGGWIALAAPPITLDRPEPGRFNFTGGMTMSPELTALLVGLVIYTAAFIGEIIRGGILAVRRGQIEAAHALGLSNAQTLRLVILPQALRVIVPPLTSQYLNLAKNSSLAIAIGYPDLFKIGQTIANQTGQSVPVIFLIMITYLIISLTISAVMNLFNRRVQVLER